MGRRLRGAALRAKKRSQQAAEEVVETTAKQVEEQHVVKQTNEELFVLDTTAVLPSKKQQDRKQAKQKTHKHQTSSKTEEARIQKLLDTHKTSSKLQQLVKQGQKTSTSARRKGRVNATFDLWEEEEKHDEEEVVEDDGPAKKRQKQAPSEVGISSMAGIVPTHKNHKSKPVSSSSSPKSTQTTVSIDVAMPGQSYNPDAKQHQKAIQDAVQVEMKRQRAEKAVVAPISTGMSAETRALLVGDSSSDSSSDEEDLEDENEKDGDNHRPMEKKKEKLTRAQRNKQKRVRAEEAAIQRRKKEKRIQNAVGEAKTIAKRLQKEEFEARERKLEVLAKKRSNLRVKGTSVIQQWANENPLHAPTLPVALPSELKKSKVDGSGTGTSLRTIKAKGSLVTDRMISFMDRGMATKKQQKKRSRVEGKRRKAKLRVRGKGHDISTEGNILG